MNDKVDQTRLSDYEFLCIYMSAFIQDILVPSLPDEKQIKRLGDNGPGVAWELKNDISSFGENIIKCGSEHLTNSELTAVSNIITAIHEIPDRVIEETGMSDRAWDSFNEVVSINSATLKACGIVACKEEGLNYYEVVSFKGL